MPTGEERRKFTEKELTQIEDYYYNDIAECHIATFMRCSRAWFETLLKDKRNDALRHAKAMGLARRSETVKRKFLDKIDDGDMKAITLWLKNREGYTETNKVQITGNDDGPLQSRSLTEEEFAALKTRVADLRAANDATEDDE